MLSYLTSQPHTFWLLTTGLRDRMATFESALTRRRFLVLGSAFASSRFCNALEPAVEHVAPQPYFAAVNRAVQALAHLGSPISTVDSEHIANLAHRKDTVAVAEAEEILNRYTLALLSLRPDGAPQITAGNAPRQLVEQGWRMFLVRVENTRNQIGSLVFTSGTRAIGNFDCQQGSGATHCPGRRSVQRAND